MIGSGTCIVTRNGQNEVHVFSGILIPEWLPATHLLRNIDEWGKPNAVIPDSEIDVIGGARSLGEHQYAGDQVIRVDIESGTFLKASWLDGPLTWVPLYPKQA